MDLSEDMQAFLVAALHAAGRVGRSPFDRELVRRSLGLAATEEAELFDALTIKCVPPLVAGSRYPAATLTAEGRKRATEITKGEPPLTGSQLGLLYGMLELGPGGQPTSFADAYFTVCKARGRIYVVDEELEGANSIAALLAGPPYRYIDLGKKKTVGSLTAGGRARIRKLMDDQLRATDERVSKLHAATLELQARQNPDDAPPSATTVGAGASTATSDDRHPPTPDGELFVDEPTFTVGLGRRKVKFTSRQKALFSLFVRISRRVGHRVYCDTLREKGNVWDGQQVEDGTIRSAVARLRTKLREGKLGAVADRIQTGTYDGRAYLLLGEEGPEANSH